MNDPHVESLTYTIRLREGYIFPDKKDSIWNLPKCDIYIGDRIFIEMKVHTSTDTEAQQIVEPYLRMLVIDTGLILQSPFPESAGPPGSAVARTALPGRSI